MILTTSRSSVRTVQRCIYCAFQIQQRQHQLRRLKTSALRASNTQHVHNQREQRPEVYNGRRYNLSRHVELEEHGQRDEAGFGQPFRDQFTFSSNARSGARRTRLPDDRSRDSTPSMTGKGKYQSYRFNDGKLMKDKIRTAKEVSRRKDTRTFEDVLDTALFHAKETCARSRLIATLPGAENGNEQRIFNDRWRAFTFGLSSAESKARRSFRPLEIKNSSRARRLTKDLKTTHEERGTQALIHRLQFLFFDSLLGSGLPDGTTTKHQKDIADIRYPSEWYPQTRMLTRTFHLHVGPTNSGKTYQALKKLEEAGTGTYAGPLRLLAHEVYSRFNAKGRHTLLITGDDRRVPDDTAEVNFDGRITACTIEMLALNTPQDVCVIDEIQMIGNVERGWAWTNAVLGVKAKEVHLCGEARTVPLIQDLCALTGDKLHIHRYERLSPLKMADSSLHGKLDKLQKGDCVVAFSVMAIHALRKQIEEKTGKKVAIVYGSLPPETRAQQAKLFNDPDNDYDYLVASDAVGMGLNLAIKRIIFESSSKNNGAIFTTIDTASIKQIAGRAGRYRSAAQAQAADTAARQNADVSEMQNTDVSEVQNTDVSEVQNAHVSKMHNTDVTEMQNTISSESTAVSTNNNDDTQAHSNDITVSDDTTSTTVSKHNNTAEALDESQMPVIQDATSDSENVGYVTTLEEMDFEVIKTAMEAEPSPILTAGIQPPLSIISRFSSYFPPETPFSYIIMKLQEICTVGSKFHLAWSKDQLKIADMIEVVDGLTVEDRHIICMAPALRDRELNGGNLFQELATCVANQSGGHLLDLKSMPLEILDAQNANSRTYLASLETLHKSLVVYLWLSFRFAGIFTSQALATHVKELVEEKITQLLGDLSYIPRKPFLDKIKRRQTEALVQESAQVAAEAEEEQALDEADELDNDLAAADAEVSEAEMILMEKSKLDIKRREYDGVDPLSDEAFGLLDADRTAGVEVTTSQDQPTDESSSPSETVHEATSEETKQASPT